MIRVSVVIPVKGDLSGLATLFESLKHQTLPSSTYQVVLVHNSFGVIEIGAKKQFETVSVAEPTGFSYTARNTGIMHSKGEFIALTDSDCIPHPTWLEEGLRCLEQEENSFVAGNISVFPGSQRPTLVEKHQMTFAFDQHVNDVLGRGFPTANLFVRRRDFDQLGLFSSSLESGGDAEWTRRAQAAGRKVVVCTDAIVFHPARRRIRDITRQRRRYARAISGFNATHDRLAFVRRWNNPRQFMWARLIKNKKLSRADRMAVAGFHLLLALLQLTFTVVELSKQIFRGSQRQENFSTGSDR